MFKTTYLVEMKEVSLTFKFINGCIVHLALASTYLQAILIEDNTMTPLIGYGRYMSQKLVNTTRF